MKQTGESGSIENIDPQAWSWLARYSLSHGKKYPNTVTLDSKLFLLNTHKHNYLVAQSDSQIIPSDCRMYPVPRHSHERSNPTDKWH